MAVTILNYEIIFYHSCKTAEIEKLISSKLSMIEMNLSQSFAATEPTELAQFLEQSLNRVDSVIIIGGLDGGKQSTDKVLSTVLSGKGSKMDSKKIVDDNENVGYIIKCREQSIIVLPDETNVIGIMLDKRIISELSETYKLKKQENKTPPIESIAGELDRQLSSIKRSPVTGIKIEEQPKKGLKAMKVGIITLGVLGLLQLLSAGYIYLTNYMF